MNRPRLTAVLLALLAWPASGCRCPQGSYDTYDTRRSCGGVFAAPAALQLATLVANDCGVSGCQPNNCLANPKSCTEMCFSLESFAPSPVSPPPPPHLIILTQFTLDPTGAPTFTLPDSRVRTATRIAYDDMGGISNVPKEELTITDGSLSVRLTQDHFEAHVSLDLTTTLGDQIKIDDATYQVNGSHGSVCNTQN